MKPEKFKFMLIKYGSSIYISLVEIKKGKQRSKEKLWKKYSNRLKNSFMSTS
jgi:hypothetical protein